MTDKQESALSVENAAALRGEETAFEHAIFEITESMTAHATGTTDNSAVNISGIDGEWRSTKPLKKGEQVTAQVFPGDKVYALHVLILFKKSV